ncbi:MAG: hypothetical protein KF810_02095 [Rhizobiaceae bacterium]|nr:hypothetical protein [Rhizobiaceae bacterium]
MSSWPNGQLVLAIAIVVAALGLFLWQILVTTKRAGYLISESRVPRRYLVLGVVIGLAIIYYTRR